MSDDLRLSNELQIGKAAEHLVACDLILQGRAAFLADQGMPYDVVVDHGSRLLRVQVRSTRGGLNGICRVCNRKHDNESKRAKREAKKANR